MTVFTYLFYNSLLTCMYIGVALFVSDLTRVLYLPWADAKIINLAKNWVTSILLRTLHNYCTVSLVGKVNMPNPLYATCRIRTSVDKYLCYPRMLVLGYGCLCAYVLKICYTSCDTKIQRVVFLTKDEITKQHHNQNKTRLSHTQIFQHL